MEELINRENNQVTLCGIIHDIEYSHSSNGKEYDKAFVNVGSGEESFDIPIKFRQDYSQYKNGECVMLLGNLRTHNKSLYVYTRFAIPETVLGSNDVSIFGRVVKKDAKYHSYIIDLGDAFVPIKSNKDFSLGDVAVIRGKLIQRMYGKRDAGDQKFVTYEVIDNDF